MLIAALPGQSILYVYYTAMAFYGWYKWGETSDGRKPTIIHAWRTRTHLIVIAGGVIISIGAYYLLAKYSSGESLVLDSVTAVFSIVATYMMTIKVIENWIYWIIIDIASLMLYLSQDLYFYVFLYAVYLVLSVYGYVNWRKELVQHDS